ncbi:Crp/Fnr family transcriptional regulator [Runella sp. MFBS21]|uniref:Crp/Fnr family transcriptional regulator n=1 Tax=Runella sp. MFBS21 TaxID=3034018 RepID=UPI0023F62383|nr:Crp/Fnr family transcriptional regulator [Runella sp. MFBS21]MDF7820447.1 Crp/Fnr family transcriptional regulator [Runella sp. MFBS21]
MKDLYQFFNHFSPLSDNTWRAVQPLFEETFLKKGAFFLQEGQIATQIGFLRKGVVRAFYRTSEGIEYNKHFFVTPSFIGGYASLITHKPTTIVLQTLTDCEILTTDFRQLTALYDNHGDLERIARKLAEAYFVQKEEREIDLVLLDAEKRYEIFQNQYPGLEQMIPQYHIASYLGVSPTQLSRIRKKISGR